MTGGMLILIEDEDDLASAGILEEEGIGCRFQAEEDSMHTG